jgi:hypothetical protein
MKESQVTTFGGKTVTTKHIPVSNHKPARIRARASAGGPNILRSYHHYENQGCESVDQVHAAAAKELIDHLEWGGTWIGGRATEDSYVFVCVGRE